MNVLESKIDSRHRVLNPRAAVIIAATALALLFGVRKVHNRQFGKTYAIWQSIADRSTLPVSAWPLLEVLERRSVHRTFRYHAAGALLRMMDSHMWSADELAADDDPDFDTRIRDFRRIVMEQVRRQTQ